MILLVSVVILGRNTVITSNFIIVFTKCKENDTVTLSFYLCRHFFPLNFKMCHELSRVCGILQTRRAYSEKSKIHSILLLTSNKEYIMIRKTNKCSGGYYNGE